MKRNRLLFLTILLLVILLLDNGHKDRYQIVARVNGDPIVLEEFKQKLVDNSASVYQYFNEKYGAVDSENFWTTGYSGEFPIEIARKKTLKELVEVKVQQQMAKEYGLQVNINYRDFMKELEEENKSRKQATVKGNVLYGPQQYDYNDYFTYSFNILRMKLQEELIGKEILVTDQDIKDFYGKNQNKYFEGISFKDARSNIQTELINTKYKKIVQNACDEAKVKINKKVYKDIFIR